MPPTIREHLILGPATSKQLQTATGLSQPKVSRELGNLGESIISLRKGRSIVYMATRNAFGGDDKLPLCIVDVYGNTVAIAYVRPLAHGGYFVEHLTGMSRVLLGENGNGLYEDLPYFLDDLRPQGFIGRHIAREMAEKSNRFPDDPRQWQADHVGRYSISNGDDLSGNLKFGPNAYLRMREYSITRNTNM